MFLPFKILFLFGIRDSSIKEIFLDNGDKGGGSDGGKESGSNDGY